MYTHIHYTFSWRGVKPLAFQNKDIDMDNICNKLKYETLPIKYTAGLFLACIYVKSRQNLTNLEDFQYTISNCNCHATSLDRPLLLSYVRKYTQYQGISFFKIIVLVWVHPDNLTSVI